MSYSSLGVILLNWHESELTRQCLINLQQQKSVCLRIVLIDNECLNTNTFNGFSDVRVIKNKTNLGYSKAVNQGFIQLLDYDLDGILLLNNDTEFESIHDLYNLDKALQSSEDVACVSPKVISYENQDYIQHAWGERHVLFGADFVGRNKSRDQFSQPKMVSILGATCLLIKPQALRDVGLWDETFFIYYDDSDWTLRCSKKEWKLFYFPSVSIRHIGGYTTQQDPYSAEFYLTKGRVLFMRKHARIWEWFPFTFGLALCVLNALIRSIQSRTYKIKFKARCRAIRDGFTTSFISINYPMNGAEPRKTTNNVSA